MVVITEDLVMAKVLIADDKDFIRKFVTQVIEGLGHEVVAVEDGVQGFEQIMAQVFDIAVVDENMGGVDKDGSRMMIRTKEAGRPLGRVIAISDAFLLQKGDPAEEARLREKWGVTWLVLLPKPFELEKMVGAIASLLAMPA